MADLVEQLRAHSLGPRMHLPDGRLTAEAADEIERLQALPTRGQMIQAMLRARDSLCTCTELAVAEACADAALKLIARKPVTTQICPHGIAGWRFCSRCNSD